MFQDMMQKTGRVLEPLLIYYLAANMIMITVGLYLDDAAFLTGLAALLLLPLYLRMYKRDRAREIYGGFGTAGERGKSGKSPDMRQPEKTRKGVRALEYIWTVSLGVFCNAVFSALVSFLQYRLHLSNAQQDALLNAGFVGQLLFVGILEPAMEEVLFRGLVYRRLKGYTGNTWVPALASSLLFAVWHGNAVQALFAFPMALILTYLYEWRDTLKIPVAFHMAVNLSTILL